MKRASRNPRTCWKIFSKNNFKPNQLWKSRLRCPTVILIMNLIVDTVHSLPQARPVHRHDRDCQVLILIRNLKWPVIKKPRLIFQMILPWFVRNHVAASEIYQYQGQKLNHLQEKPFQYLDQNHWKNQRLNPKITSSMKTSIMRWMLEWGQLLLFSLIVQIPD